MSISQFLSLFNSQMNDREYEGASRTLRQLQTLGLDEYQLKILTANLYDTTDRVKEAELIYREVLKSPAPNSLINQARQGLQVIQERERQIREANIALEMTENNAKDDGLLYLLPIEVSQKERTAEALTRIFNLDIYTARSSLPTRHPRIYRLGRYGELKVFSNELTKLTVKNTVIRLKSISEIPVYNVLYLAEERAGIVAITAKDRISLTLEDVTTIVKGQVPMFEDVVMGVDRNYRVVREEQTKEYLSILDLHCGDFILRLEDQIYQFNQGKQFAKESLTMGARWRDLVLWLESAVKGTIRDEFFPFAEMSLLYPETLEEVTPKVNFKRVKDVLWDHSFQLYSGSIFLLGTTTDF